MRAAGLLFIRFLSPPDQLWARLYLFLMEDDAENKFSYSSDQQRTISIGDFVRQLLEDKQFLGQTVLPRIPTLVNRDIQAKLHFLDERRSLKQLNEQRH